MFAVITMELFTLHFPLFYLCVFYVIFTQLQFLS